MVLFTLDSSIEATPSVLCEYEIIHLTCGSASEFCVFSYCGRSGGGWRVHEPGCNLYRTLDTRKAGLQCASARVASVQSTGQTLLCNTDTHTSSLQTHRQKDKGSKAPPFPFLLF